MVQKPTPTGSMLVTMTRNEITEQIVVARLAEGPDVAGVGRRHRQTGGVDHSPHCSGNTRFRAELGKVLVEMLGIDQSAVPVLAAVPMRGGLPTAVPTDPTIYRFYEVLQVYGAGAQRAHP